jgi:hypothetical protein
VNTELVHRYKKPEKQPTLKEIRDREIAFLKTPEFLGATENFCKNCLDGLGYQGKIHKRRGI